MGRKKYSKVKNFRVFIKRKYLLPFLDRCADFIKYNSDKFYWKIKHIQWDFEKEYKRHRCHKVECCVCYEKQYQNHMVELDGFYYCNNKKCQKEYDENHMAYIERKNDEYLNSQIDDYCENN